MKDMWSMVKPWSDGRMWSSLVRRTLIRQTLFGYDNALARLKLVLEVVDWLSLSAAYLYEIPRQISLAFHSQSAAQIEMWG